MILYTKEYHTKWHIVKDKKKDKVLTDVLEIHFIELKKFIKADKKPENKKEELERIEKYNEQTKISKYLK